MILLFRIFKTLSIPNSKSWGAKILRECSTPTMWHMSCVTCYVSRVTCFFGQSGGASRWSVCYQRGLPRLVSICFRWNKGAYKRTQVVIAHYPDTTVTRSTSKLPNRQAAKSANPPILPLGECAPLMDPPSQHQRTCLLHSHCTAQCCSARTYRLNN